ncbi:AAA family ATPase [Mariniblastus fucicola]|uniref:Septum site-determining protein MinD n=1 Tax=Mariniblastus fucicola TaxID=980251 RepID=A0A5B9P360_9BACT|nr:AAA family ATPase [Mariniblastus fucicola]QEG20977.1 Septum site-determining protein MinD [Mariniblastus fucicola]
MSGTLRISICDPDETSRENLKKFLIGMDKVWLEADCSRYEFFREIVGETTPDVAIIAIDGDTERALSLVADISQEHPTCGVIVVSSVTDGQLILRAMRSGAREFLNSPVQLDELMGALDRVSSNGSGSGQRSKSGVIIPVAGASGGVGATSIAVNMAVSLAQNPERSVVLVDLDLALGDADIFLDLMAEYTLLDVAQNIARLDLALLRKSLTKHQSGVYLLPRPVQIEDNASISEDDLRKVLGLLKASFSHVIVDLSKSYNRLDMVALEASTYVMLLTQLDLPCLRNVVRLLASFERYEGVSERVKVVVNRAGLEKSQISLEKAEKTIGGEIYARISNNYAVISECRNNGIPLLEQAPKAAITQQITELGDRLSGDSSSSVALDDDAKEKKGWLNFLSK